MRIVTLALCMSTFAVTTTYADSVTETGSLSIDVSTAGSQDSLSFAQFNSSLGTLTGVSIDLNGNANSVFSVVTNSTSAFTVTGGSSSTLQLSGSGFTSASTPTLTASVTGGTVNGNTSSNPFAVTYFPGASSAFDLSASVGNGNLANYVGSGTSSVLAAFSPFTSTGSPGNPAGTFAAVGGAGQATGNLTVTYTFTPVPVPAGGLLLLSGLGGLGLFGVRRSARSVLGDAPLAA